MPCSYAQTKIEQSWDRKPAGRRSAMVLWLIVQQHLSKAELRVVLYLAMRWDMKGKLQLSQEEIADELGMRQSHVAAAIKGLKEEHELIARSTGKKPHKYRIRLETIEQAIRAAP